MLAIGRALLTNPRLLILDEATEGLAPLVRQEIWHAIQGLKRDGLTLIVVDKNLRTSDRNIFAMLSFLAPCGPRAPQPPSPQPGSLNAPILVE